MKKIIAILMILSLSLGLTSCFKEATYEEVMTSMKKEISKDIYETFPMAFESVEEKGEMKLNVVGDENATINATLAYTAEGNIETGDAKLSVDLNAGASIMGQESTASASAEAIVIAEGNNTYLKVNDITVGGPYAAMIQPMLAGIEKNVWFHFANAEAPSSMQVKTMLKKLNEELVFSELFTLIDQVENENFYEYNVKLNAEKIKSLAVVVAEIMPADAKEEFLSEFNSINQADLDKESSLNLKVDKKDRSFFELTITETESSNPGKVVIVNSKEKLGFEAYDRGNKEWEFLINKLGDDKYEAIVSIDESTEKKSLALDITLSDKASSVKLKETDALKEFMASEGITTLELELNSEYAKKNVKVEAPAESKPLEEAIGALMGGWF